MSIETYAVTGMTCGHCVSSVAAEVGGLPGVNDVQVELETGRVTVTSDEPLGQDKVRAAVEDAGYTLVG